MNITIQCFALFFNSPAAEDVCAGQMNPTSITLVKPFGIPKVFSSVLLMCGVCTEVEKCSPLNRMFSPERDTRQGA